MAPSESYNDSMRSVSAAYRSRVGDVAASEKRDADEAVETDHLEHELHELSDEQKFVGGVDVKKDAASEEEFLPTPAADETTDEDVETPKTEKQPAKKTATKKS